MKKEPNNHAPIKPVKPPTKRDFVFKTIPVNHAEKIKIVIDGKTTVYCNPGDDMGAIREKWEKKLGVKK